MSIRHLFFMCFSLAFSISFAQVKPQEICATMEQDSLNRARFPQRGTLGEFEDVLQQHISFLKREIASGRGKATLLNIPIIVHVVHNGEAIGNGTNLSAEQVAAQIEVLNEDFRRMDGTPGFNDDPVGADIEIEFCLSPVDEDGNPMDEPGVHRYDGNQPDWSRDEIENKLKPNTIWNPNLFYNIWTVKFDASASTLIGYAQFPDQSGLPGLQEKGGPATTDGVVIRYQSFGSVTKGDFPVMQAPYNRGRTLTHETGHWLGLRHIWGDGNCANDFVADTPTAAGPSTGCQVGRISCGGVNMVQNYMDYSDDVCMNIFTEGQKLRMRAVIDISPRRKSLVDGNLCSPVVAEAPVANFRVDKLDCVLLGSEVNFTDLSSNFPNEWFWTFEGGDPNTATERNPNVIYNAPGTFDVQLIVKNAIGADTLLLPDFITISEEGLCADFTNFLPEYTPSVLPLSDFGSYSGHLTGHNSIGSQAFSEFFFNECGYKYISGADVKFGALSWDNEEAKVFITVWNARGPQSSPGSIIERKEVLLKQIQEDVDNDRPTSVTFDRETPVFSRAFHVGVEIEYDEGYTLAIVSSANGEATQATSWVKDSSGKWELFTIALGANIAMSIVPQVGVNPSVQVSASKQLVYPGEEVTLNGRGASIFVWNADNGSVVNVAGPQLIVNPTQTTTYITTGSGLDLCHTEARTTVFMREEGVVGVEHSELGSHGSLHVYPNPGGEQISVEIDNGYRGNITVQIYSALGVRALPLQVVEKSQDHFVTVINTTSLTNGLYIVKVLQDGESMTIKWVKHDVH